MEKNQNTDDKKEKLEFTKKAIKFGNSAGVLLPKSLLGTEVKVTIINKPINIKKDMIEILENYFENILGIYITNISKDLIEILAISFNIKKIIHSGKYKISIVPLSIIKKDLKDPRLKIKLNQSKPILNKKLLFDLKQDINKS